MKYILTFMVLALCGSLAIAQTDAKAKAILDKTVEHIKSYPAVEIVFDLSMINKAEDINETHHGKAYMKDKMYRIDVMDVVNYFDGEVIYTYMPDQEEVNIKNPEENEDEMLNPSILSYSQPEVHPEVGGKQGWQSLHRINPETNSQTDLQDWGMDRHENKHGGKSHVLRQRRERRGDHD